MFKMKKKIDGRPMVLTVTRRHRRKHKWIDYTGEYHLELLIRLGVFPIMVPVVRGTLGCLDQYLQMMDGLLLVEGEDIYPEHYDSHHEHRETLDPFHHFKDRIELKACRYALERGMPILGLCRGSQLLNVVKGGSLYIDVQREMPSYLKHVDFENYDGYRHPVKVLKKTPLYHWYRRENLMVNSYHHQGVKRLAKSFKPMAKTTDGLLEGFYDPNALFTVGLQFHPERMLHEYKGNLRVWEAFTTAIKRYAVRMSRG